jgi:phosphonate transport system substrate-binding protein
MSRKKSPSVLLITAILLATLLSAQSAFAQEGEIGSEDKPIQVYFVPSVEVENVVTGGEVMAEALEAATGLKFEVFVPTSYAATVEAMCASPDNTIGFLATASYVIANAHCGVQVGAASSRYGWAYYWAQYVVRRDSDIYVFGDLEGKTWGYGDPASTSGYIVPLVELQAAGIEVGDTVETGGHPQTILAVYNGEVDFGTTYFSAPQTPGAPWAYGDPPEPYDLSVDESYIGEDGNLYVGDIRVMDARSAVRETAPDVVDQVRILRISAAIPNDTVSFGPDFPADLREEIIDALIEFTQTEACNESICNFYNWTGVERIEDKAFDPVREQIEILGWTAEDILGG